MSLRVRRTFSEAFKKAAVKRLKTASAAEVARACGVNVRVLHRWLLALGNHQVKPTRGRRKYTKEFKQAALKRIERGKSVNEVARAVKLSPTLLYHWQREFRDYGAAAFSGYGRSRSRKQPTQTVIVRFTADEYSRLKAAFAASTAQTLPDFARAHLIRETAVVSVGEIQSRLNELLVSLRQLGAPFRLQAERKLRAG